LLLLPIFLYTVYFTVMRLLASVYSSYGRKTRGATKPDLTVAGLSSAVVRNDTNYDVHALRGEMLESPGPKCNGAGSSRPSTSLIMGQGVLEGGVWRNINGIVFLRQVTTRLDVVRHHDSFWSGLLRIK
jgi:hypothetical protein